MYKPNPKVSVIIPNFNHARYLDQRLSSVLGQSYQNFEIIILDDCSTDESKEIIEAYRSNPKVREIIYNQQNSGSTFRQWEKGIAAAQGEFVWIAESDDFCEKEFLKEALEPFHEQPDIVLTYTKSLLYIDEKNEFVKNSWGKCIQKDNGIKSYIADGQTEISEVLLYLNSILNASAVVFKKETLLEFDFSLIKNYKYTGDWMLYSHLLQNGKLAFIAKPLNFFRIHNRSTRINKTISEELVRFKEIFFIIKKNRKVAIQNVYKINFKYFYWIFEEWTNKKSRNIQERILLFKIVPSFLRITYAKFLCSFYKKKLFYKIKLY